MQFLPLTIFLLAKWALANSKGHPWKKCQRKKISTDHLASIPNYLNPEKKRKQSERFEWDLELCFISHAAVICSLDGYTGSFVTAVSEWELLCCVWMAAVQQIRRFSLSALIKSKNTKKFDHDDAQLNIFLDFPSAYFLFCFGWRA